MKNYIIILCFLSISFSQVFSHYDYTGSRATSMSGAVTSGPGTLDYIFHNPAQLSELNRWQSKIIYKFVIVYTRLCIVFQRLNRVMVVNSRAISSEFCFKLFSP